MRFAYCRHCVRYVRSCAPRYYVGGGSRCSQRHLCTGKTAFEGLDLTPAGGLLPVSRGWSAARPHVKPIRANAIPPILEREYSAISPSETGVGPPGETKSAPQRNGDSAFCALLAGAFAAQRGTFGLLQNAFSVQRGTEYRTPSTNPSLQRSYSGFQEFRYLFEGS